MCLGAHSAVMLTIESTICFFSKDGDKVDIIFQNFDTIWSNNIKLCSVFDLWLIIVEEAGKTNLTIAEKNLIEIIFAAPVQSSKQNMFTFKLNVLFSWSVV